MRERRPQEVEMSRKNTGTYVLAAAVLAAALILAGVPFATLLPFAILLLCPLMMIFMMRGMSQAGNSSKDDADNAEPRR